MHSFFKLFIVLFIGLAAYLGSIANYDQSSANAYHSPQEQNYFRGSNIDLPLSDNGYFKASGNCDGCHGLDETGFANTDEAGNDISPVTLWRAGMMANSAKDPFWLAKVSHEVAVNPQHKEALEDKCTGCHAPLGHYSNIEFNLGAYSMDTLAVDSMGLDGVSCLACHKQSTQNLGAEHSGVLHFIGAPVSYGPYEKPFSAPMQDLVGILPVYSEHINDAGICAGCHTLLTNSVDLSGNFTGQTFVEQATYHEWLNSSYADEQNETTCQGCHMPQIDDEVVISANYASLNPRTPVGKHELVGGNSFMLKLMKQNRTELGIFATDEHFDSTIARTERMLQHLTMNLDLSFVTFANDTGYFEVRLENLCGHKFPSGYPSRRAYIEFLVIQDDGDTLFKSGVLQPDYEVLGQNSDYEPHYAWINNEQQVQIYEMVMVDVNSDVTTILERAFAPVKDNRLAPLGFTTSHAVYDTTSIVGNATTDSNFNFDGFEGSGTDVVSYHVPLNGYNGTIKTTARVYYQVAPPKWMEELFATSTPTIDTFEIMYNNADQTPVLIAEDSIVNMSVVTSIAEDSAEEFMVYPNPTNDGLITLVENETGSIEGIDIYNTRGQLVAEFDGYPTGGIRLPDEPGIYLIRISSENREQIVRILRK